MLRTLSNILAFWLVTTTACFALTDRTPRPAAPASAPTQQNAPDNRAPEATTAPVPTPQADATSPATTGVKPTVMVIEIHEPIDSPALYILRRGLKEAEEKKYDVVVLDLKTPGGSVGAAFDMMEALGKFSGKTFTYVNDEAISAGAFIAASTNEIWFAPNGVIGASAAVTSDGKDIPETMRLKINSFLRAKIRAISDGKGYRGQVIEAMIDKDYELVIDGEVIKPKGELLSRTAKEAMKMYGNPPQPLLGAGIASTIDDLLSQKFGTGNYESYRLEITWSERLAKWLNMIKPILLGLGILALFIEFKTPGFGFFGISGIILLAVVFLSSYVAGLSGYEPVIVFAIGLLLLLVELIFFPGVVVMALSGIVLMVGALIWSMADLWPNEPISVAWSNEAFLAPFLNLTGGVAIAAILIALLLRFMPRGWFWDRIMLSAAVAGSAQTASVAPGQEEQIDNLVGRKATVITPLRPFGQIEVDGHRFEARLTVGSADRGSTVIITKRTDFGIDVEPIDNPSAPEQTPNA